MQPRKLQYGVIHCTATPEGRHVSSDEILQWHLGPLHNANGTYTYKGKVYPTLASLPDDCIGGVHITELKGRGWSKPGYSDMIDLEGNLINLIPYDKDDEVDLWEITNGVAGINGCARHIVYVGGMDKAGKVAKDTRNIRQLNTLRSWIQVTLKYAPEIKFAGHNQFANKACPSFFVPAYLHTIGIDDKNIYKPL